MNEHYNLDYYLKNNKIRLITFNPVIGGLKENTNQIIQSIDNAKKDSFDAIVFPELALTGYPPDDLLLYDSFLESVESSLDLIQAASEQIMIIIGAPKKDGQLLFNSLFVYQQQKLVTRYDKQALPNYGVFNERRFFSPGEQEQQVALNDLNIGLTICEDMWDTTTSEKLINAYSSSDLIINISASPFQTEKVIEREALFNHLSSKAGKPILYCNLFGATDQLIFDGHCFVSEQIVKQRITPLLTEGQSDPESELSNALTIALRDYVYKNNFEDVVIGLSGGLDSALVLLLAIKALGKEHVKAVIMPTCYSSQETQTDAEQLALACDIEYQIIPIEDLRESYSSVLKPLFAGLKEDVTEENIQARIRGNLLMALSNKFNWMVIATGNKSELSVGYSTLYGDMSGGYSLIKDVLKTEAFRLSQWLIDQQDNSLLSDVMQSIIDRPPSAELSEDQKDSDSLPAYQVLDPIIIAYIEQHKSYQQIVDSGFDRKTVSRVIKMINRAEHKRQQSSPGPKVRFNAYGSERRMPIINHFDFINQ
jgi:NAD+ synthase (glutamine-hydrolysing)